MSSSTCQLAQDWRGDALPARAIVEQKIDGWRCLYFRGADGVARLWSRNGMPLHGADHVLYRLGLLERMAGRPMVFDGEIQVGGTLAATKHWFETGWRQGGERGHFHAFDCLPYPDWLKGGSDAPLIERKAMLRDLAGKVEADPALSWEWRPGSKGRDDGATPVSIVPDTACRSAGAVLDLALQVWNQGGEGLMLKDADSPYQRNRNRHWLKVKPCGPWTRKL